MGDLFTATTNETTGCTAHTILRGVDAVAQFGELVDELVVTRRHKGGNGFLMPYSRTGIPRPLRLARARNSRRNS